MAKIVVSVSSLGNALGWVSRALPSRVSGPTSGGILLEVSGNSLRLSAHDDLESTTITIPIESHEGKFGKKLLPGRTLNDIVKVMPKGEVSLEDEDNQIVLSAGRSVFRLPIFPLKGYIAAPGEPENPDYVDGKLFADAVKRVAVAAGKDDALPILTAVQIAADPATSTMRMVATDRFRLALREIPYQPGEGNTEPWSVLVVSKDIEGYARGLADEQNLRISPPRDDDHRIGLGGGDRYVSVRVLDGDYPKWEPVLDKFSGGLEATFDAAEVLSAVKRVSLMSDRSSPIILEFDPVGEVTISASGGVGTAVEAVACAWSGEESMSMGFNILVLSEGLGVSGSGDVVLHLSEPTRPGLLRTVEAQGTYRHLMMPLRSV